MKPGISYLLISFLILSCSKKEDTSTDVVPASPTELTAQLAGNTQVTLSWKDNSTNETGFKIERKNGNSNYIQIATVGSDVTHYANTGLAANTEYSYRVLAYNAVGNSANYSNQVTINSVIIGTQCWMQKNLDIDHYRNGDPIPQVTSPTEWQSLTTGAWCYYGNKIGNDTIYGKLYNWYAVNDPRGLAPQGWHVATSAEWNTLTEYLGGTTIAGGALKAMEHWTSPNTGATNSSGFTALGGGFRNTQGVFSNAGILGGWWTADSDNSEISFYRVLYNSNTKSEGYHIQNTVGLAVRCVKD